MNASIHAGAFRTGPRFGMRVVEAAPARRRIAALMSLILIVFGALGVRVAYLGIAGAVAPKARTVPIGPPSRAPLLDREGALLAVTARSWALIARPHEVWKPAEVSAALRQAIPSLDPSTLDARLTSDRKAVYLRRDITPAEHAKVFALGLPGIDFEEEPRRAYPNGLLAAHFLGGAKRDLGGAGGAERLLDARLTGPDAHPVRLSLDLRVQHAVERELAAAALAADAKGAAGIILDGRTGETLALASWPTFDPNTPPPGDDPRRLNRAIGAVFEPGSVVKPLVWAAVLDAKLTTPSERFSSAAFEVGGLAVRDMSPATGRLTLEEGLEASSNVVAAQLGMRLGAPRLIDALTRAGLLRESAFPLAETAAPLKPDKTDPTAAAAMSYGYGFAAPLIALAEAYTVFCNQGAAVNAGIIAVKAGDPVATTPVFSAEATEQTLAMMRAVVARGTAKRASAGGVALAGKTGTAEKPAPGGGYDRDRMLSSFAGVFPAENPRYVIVVALDEPARTAAAGGQATGGAVAAPAAAHILARIAPLLGITTDAGQKERAP